MASTHSLPLPTEKKVCPGSVFDGTRHPRVRDRDLNDNITERACPLDNGRHHDSPKYDLGKLENLPLELQHSILAQADLQALTTFRRVNRRAMEVVDSVPQYSAVIQQSPQSIRAILSVELGAHITCRTLFEALHAEKCACCGKSAEYIYLLNCRRVCLGCLTWDVEFRPLTLQEASTMYDVPIHMLKRLPALKSIPGKYSFDAPSYTERLTLVDHFMALLAASFWAGVTSVSGEAARPLAETRQEAFMFLINMDRYWLESASRFMSAVHAPCIKRTEEATQ